MTLEKAEFAEDSAKAHSSIRIQKALLLWVPYVLRELSSNCVVVAVFWLFYVIVLFVLYVWMFILQGYVLEVGIDINGVGF